MRIPLSEPNLRGNELEYLTECVRTNFVSSVGKFVTDFEDAFASYLGVKRAVAVVNGTAALHLAILLADVGFDDEVLVPNLTFVAPVNVVRYVGAHPILIDAQMDNFGMSPAALESFLRENAVKENGQCINRKTGRRIKAVIPVHVFGMPADMEGLLKIAQEFGLSVIEDASESLGSKYQGQYTGTIAKVGCFSFNGNKIMTSGGGGMLVTNDVQLADRAKHMSTTAKTDGLYFEHNEVGYNYRMVNLLAAVGLAQLENLDCFLSTKLENAQAYSRQLANVPGLRFHLPKESNQWFYSLIVGSEFPLSKEELMRYLIERGVDVRPVWKLMEDLVMYRDCEKTDTSCSRQIYNSVINLPCSTTLTVDQVERVCTLIREAGRARAQEMDV